MEILSKEQILGADDLVVEQVEVPEWGGAVLVRTMTGKERDRFEELTYHDGGADLDNMRARLVSLTVVNEQGGAVFTEDDITALGKKSSKALDRVLDKARELNGLTREDLQALLKNSEAIQEEDSGSV